MFEISSKATKKDPTTYTLSKLSFVGFLWNAQIKIAKQCCEKRSKYVFFLN